MGKKLRLSIPAGALALMFFTLGFSLACRQTKENSAEAFDKIARTILKNVYPYLAKQIKEDYGITRGTCVDAGAGSAYLSIELAKVTNLEIRALDIDPDALEIAGRNIRKAGLADRIKLVLGDVQKMPFADRSVDLVVSRGSFLFWKDKVKAFREIWRILKPGGVAYVGGGVSRLLPPDEKEIIREKMNNGEFGPPKDLWIGLEDMSKILREAGIAHFEVTNDEACVCGMWIEFKKPKMEK